MNNLTFAFLPGTEAVSELPLFRFLPALPSGIVAGWLRKNISHGSWIIDPLGATPALALEAARAGYRVLVTSNNPILSFMSEVLASAPSEANFQAELSELADVRRGSERLEIHLQSLYQTECAACGQTIHSQAYLWKRGESQPYARLYRCPHCGDEGEHPITPRDLERLAIPGNPSLHRARALERVNLGQDNLRESVDEALNAYLPRALYFTLSLINKIEGMSIPEDRRRLLLALALTVCDEASSLFAYPSALKRPRQILVPPQFRENNLWLSLEKAVQFWSSQDKPVSFSHWPELPSIEGGICLYPGRLKSLGPLPESIKLAGAVTVFPRPNQAFWTLSAIWSGWLWGRAAVLPLKSALERQRYDWNWHTNALSSTLVTLRKQTPKEFPLFGLLPDLVPGFLAAAIIAAEAAGFNLQGLALRSEQEFAQAFWHSGEPRSSPILTVPSISREAIIRHLSERNEPAPYLSLFTASLASLEDQGALAFSRTKLSNDILTNLLPGINQIFSDLHLLKRYESASQNLESGLWWLQETPEPSLTLADRVEMELVRFLQKHPDCSFLEIDETLCSLFPGLLTPPIDLIKACLSSYAENPSDLSTLWRLRPQENPAARKADLRAVNLLLQRISQRLGYQCQGESPIIWQAENGEAVYQFYPMASSTISRYVLSEPAFLPNRCILIIPGSRSNLLAYKLHRDPHLAQAVASGWHFLKFRYLRQLAERMDLSRKSWEYLLDGDPPTWDEVTQMKIFS